MGASDIDLSIRALTLTLWELKRAARRRRMFGVLLALPLAAALARAIFSTPGGTLAIRWSCPLVCAAVTTAFIWSRTAADRISGLDDGLRSAPVPASLITGARVAAGAVIFLVQMAVLCGILAL